MSRTLKTVLFVLGGAVLLVGLLIAGAAVGTKSGSSGPESMGALGEVIACSSQGDTDEAGLQKVIW